MADIEKLKDDYNAICDRYAEAFCEMYDYSMTYCWWVSDERGGVFIVNDCEISLGMEDLTYAVNNQVPEKDFMEWWEYCLNDEKYNLSLRQYMKIKKIEQQYGKN